MAYEDFIGLRYLMAKRRSRVVSVITLFAVAGVALGVTALIVVLSVMGGFKKDLKQKILGTKAHIVIQTEDGGPLKDPRKLAERARSVDGVVGAAPFVEGETMASSPTNLSGMMLRGIPPETVGEVSDLNQQLTEESKLEYLESPNKVLEDLEDRNEDSFEGLIDGEELDLGGGAASPDDTPGASAEGSTEAESPDVGTTSLSESLGEPADPSESEQPVKTKHSQRDGTSEGAPSSDDQGTMPAIVPGRDEDSDNGSENETHNAGNNGGEALDKGPGPDDIKGMTSSGDSAGGMPSIAGDESETASALPGLFLGVELADTLKVDLGDEVNVVTPEGEMGPTGPLPQSRPFRVVGLFKTGMYEYDANYGYTHIRDAKDFFGVDGATGIELKTPDPARAMAIADTLRGQMPEGVEVMDWREMNRSLFFALQLEKIGMFLMLTLIVIVASFSIVAMLIMIVLEKSRDISVLKSLGVSRGGIMRIFMFQGVFIGSIGAAIGLALGLGICWAMIEFGFPLNSEVYYIKTLPVDVQPSEVVTVVICTVVISFLATLYPSLRAASLRPVEGLRYE